MNPDDIERRKGIDRRQLSAEELRKALHIGNNGLSLNYLDDDFEDMLVFCKIAGRDPNFIQNGSYRNEISPALARVKLAAHMKKYRTYTEVVHTDVRYARYLREFADDNAKAAAHRLDEIAQEIKAISAVSADQINIEHVRHLLEESNDLIMIPGKK